MSWQCEEIACLGVATHLLRTGPLGYRQVCYRHFADAFPHLVDVRPEPALHARARGVFDSLMADRCLTCGATPLVCRGHPPRD
jgi:hypothetical protein